MPLESLAALIAFTLVTLTVMLIGLLSPRSHKPAKRKPNPTPYVGPRYNAHGREMARVGRSVL